MLKIVIWFLKTAARDYDMDYETVKDIYIRHFPDNFYKELEKYVKRRKFK